MKILIFDNYDSFTYNLVHMVEGITNEKADVYRNDKISLESINEYDKIILSPGPGLPCESGLLLPLIKKFAPSKSIMGVCLGQQAIAEVFGGKLINLKNVYHGVATKIKIDEYRTKTQNDVFKDLPSEFEAGRYHSWVVDSENFPQDLEITARDEDGLIMGLRHRTYDVQGVQFHPESVLTPEGEKMMRNWLSIV
ncbi:aminodeoxychorismate/anthranilate synthase component II [Hanamia caeni]|uniref:Aminodeoxychorismate/anthranilate synthase component II n=1 Tax=Hanamia caeni TaxID=2294116 RepID=A0A3M9N4P3_9BACT|nr:aminodeoxychorismate/anthranilate synthase component II [Hanamia caeni]RNI32709.1 aminodeoxychorismate/anthranilate synthase component II [Hanamia caeni]